MPTVIKKMIYYSDFSLHGTIIMSMLIVMRYQSRGYHLAVPTTVAHRQKNITSSCVAKLRRYCALWLTIRLKLGFHDRCFFRSVLFCRVFRLSGIDARLNFGTGKAGAGTDNEWHMSGHCWVSFGNETQVTDYPFVFQYPCKATT